MNKLKYYILLVFLFSMAIAQGQEQEQLERMVIQFSGVVVTEGINGDPEPLPYTSISIMGTSRGTLSDSYGYFSFVAQAGDTVVFSRIGFSTVKIGIPDSLEIDRYSWQQIMSQDAVLLPEAVIYPWPSKEHFKFDFLAIDITNQLREQKDANLASNVLKELRYELPADGAEAYNFVAEKQLQEYKYAGQFKPQNIFNPLAWKKFIEAWKRGDFKRKK